MSSLSKAREKSLRNHPKKHFLDPNRTKLKNITISAATNMQTLKNISLWAQPGPSGTPPKKLTFLHAFKMRFMI